MDTSLGTVSITEAAAMKGVARSTIHKAIQTGRLPAEVSIGPHAAAGRWRIRHEDLDAWKPMSTEERARIAGSSTKKPRARKPKAKQASTGEDE